MELRRAGRPARPRRVPTELPVGHTRKEVEGVFVIRDGKAQFVIVEVGIAGERYFEVIVGTEGGRPRDHRAVRQRAQPVRGRHGAREHGGHPAVALQTHGRSMQQIWESVKLALASIWANKLRSLLTLLGNIVAVSSIIAVVALIQGVNARGVRRHRLRPRRRRLHHPPHRHRAQPGRDRPAAQQPPHHARRGPRHPPVRHHDLGR